MKIGPALIGFLHESIIAELKLRKEKQRGMKSRCFFENDKSCLITRGQGCFVPGEAGLGRFAKPAVFPGIQKHPPARWDRGMFVS